MNLADAVTNLGLLTLKFGEVNRITFHADGTTPEADTTHTVMLGLVACALAKEVGLDTGRVAQYALVHDLPEVYAGDTPTLRALSTDAKADKKTREHDAYVRILNEFGLTLPWVDRTIATYERQESREARFVRAVDKLLPKITHVANGCTTLLAESVGYDELVARYELQERELKEYADDFPVVFELRAALVGRVLDMYREVTR